MFYGLAILGVCIVIAATNNTLRATVQSLTTAVDALKVVIERMPK